jgi:hypothetical protein
MVLLEASLSCTIVALGRGSRYVSQDLQSRLVTGQATVGERADPSFAGMYIDSLRQEQSTTSEAALATHERPMVRLSARLIEARTGYIEIPQ